MVFFASLVFAVLLVIVPEWGISASLSVDVEILNGVLMPFVVFFLWYLCCREDVLVMQSSSIDDGKEGPRERAKSILASLTSSSSKSSNKNKENELENDVRGIIMGEKRIYKFSSCITRKNGINEMFPTGVKVEFIDDLIS